MKILVITGSPHKKGTSALLADEFIAGANSAGHSVTRFNAAFEKVNPCIACDNCYIKGACVHDDSFTKLIPELVSTDMVVLVTPLYYFGMSAQLKCVIDRFYSINAKVTNKSAMLIVTCGAEEDEKWMADALIDHYKTLCEYLNWQDKGQLIAYGVYTRGDIEKTDYPLKARQLGASVK